MKYFFRWFYNTKNVNGFLGTIEPEENVHIPFGDWKTPAFFNIDKKKTKRLSPYLETELWEKRDIITIIKYDNYKRKIR